MIENRHKFAYVDFLLYLCRRKRKTSYGREKFLFRYTIMDAGGRHIWARQGWHLIVLGFISGDGPVMVTSKGLVRV